MDVAGIPFNRFLGLRLESPALRLPADSKFLNHVGTVHAGAQFSLAEAASGQWLLDRFGERAAEYLAIVRHAEVRYRRPARGELVARAEVSTEEFERFRDALERRGRASIEILVKVLAGDGGATLEGSFEWFAQRASGSGSQ
jgi:thioesterase domain-containing protein